MFSACARAGRLISIAEFAAGIAPGAVLATDLTICSSRPCAEVSAEAVCQAAAAGHPLAVRELTTTRQAILAALHSVQHLFNPQAHVFGGGLAAGLRPFLNDYRAQLAARFPWLHAPPRVEVSDLNDVAALLGAAQLFNENKER